MLDKKTQNEDKNAINPVVAAAAVAGAVAVAAMAINTKENQDKVQEVLTDAKDKAVDYVEGMKEKAHAIKAELGEKIADGKDKLAQAIKDS